MLFKSSLMTFFFEEGTKHWKRLLRGCEVQGYSKLRWTQSTAALMKSRSEHRGWSRWYPGILSNPSNSMIQQFCIFTYLTEKLQAEDKKKEGINYILCKKDCKPCDCMEHWKGVDYFQADTWYGFTSLTELSRSSCFSIMLGSQQMRQRIPGTCESWHLFPEHLCFWDLI